MEGSFFCRNEHWLDKLLFLLIVILILSVSSCLPGPEPMPEDLPRFRDCNRNGIWDIGELGHRPFGFEEALFYSTGDEPSDVAAGDFDNDGDLDLVVSNRTGNTVSILINNGRGRFVSPTVSIYPVGTEPIRVVSADFNGDNLDDIAVAHSLNEIRILLNNNHSPGTFDDAGSFTVAEAAGAWEVTDLATEDLDADGFADLAVTAYHGSNYRLVLFWNQGDGSFGPPQHYQVVTNQPKSVAIFDIDQDDDMDLSVGGILGQLALVQNRGGRSFLTPTRAYDPRDPSAWGEEFLYYVGSGAILSLSACDLNRDGFPELVISIWRDRENVFILPNRGTAGWGFERDAFVSLEAGFRPNSLAVTDLDTDGRADIVIGTYIGENISVLLNKGRLTFERYRLIHVGNRPVSLEAVNLDGLGSADLAVVCREDDQLAVLLNASTISRDCNQNNIPDECEIADGSSIDCNEDGFPDECNLYPLIDFSPREFGTGRSTMGYDPALTSFDLDDDGDMDLLTVNSWRDELPRAWFNQGNAHLNDRLLVDRFENIEAEGIWIATDHNSVSIANTTEGTVDIYYQSTVIGLAWYHYWCDQYTFEPGIQSIWRGDLNGDDRSDLITIPYYSTSQIAIYRNTGARELPLDRRNRYYNDENCLLIPLADIPASEPPTAVAVVDLNSDGLPEILFTNFRENTVAVCVNRSTTDAVRFSLPCICFASGPAPKKVEVGDFNGDGRLDLAVANDYSNEISLLMNESRGTAIDFASRIPVQISPDRDASPKDMAVADFDDDGDLDFATANWGSDNVSILRNVGDGTFADPLLFAAGFRPEAIKAVYLDENRIPDLAVANGNGIVTVLLNRTYPPMPDENDNGIPDQCE